MIQHMGPHSGTYGPPTFTPDQPSSALPTPRIYHAAGTTTIPCQCCSGSGKVLTIEHGQCTCGACEGKGTILCSACRIFNIPTPVAPIQGPVLDSSERTAGYGT